MNKIILLLITGCFASITNAQILNVCPNGPVFSDNCVTACLSCNFLVPFNTNNSSYTVDDPNDDCLLMHNNMWFAFRAFESTVTFSAVSSNCDLPEGIQIAVYEGCQGPCLFFDYGCDASPVSVTATGLEIGTIYYVVIDGCNGAICDIVFDISPLSAVIEPVPDASDQLQGPTEVCINGTFTYCIEPVIGVFRYEWTVPPGVLVNGMPGPIVYLPGPAGNCADITFGPTPGSGEICVRSLGCNEGLPKCISVTSAPFPETILPPIILCPEDVADYSLPWDAPIQSTPGTKEYQQTFQTEFNCDSLVKISVTVLAPITTNLPPQYLCPGGCFLVGGEPYCTPGNYVVSVPSSMGCDSNVAFILVPISLNAQITQTDTLSCNTTSITLYSVVQSNVTKVWKNASGLILGTADSLLVSQPGKYYLSVSSNLNSFNCTLLDSIVVKKDTLMPSVQLSADTLDCTSNPALIQVATNSISAAFWWNGPAGFSASVADTFVVFPGLYTVTVTNLANGCTNSASIPVPINFIPPPLVLDTSEQIDCNHPVVSLHAQAASAIFFEWTGPNGFVSQLQQPQVDAAGDYTVTVKDTSGCINSATITISENLIPPLVFIAGDTISCAQPMAFLQASVQTGTATYEWFGPDGFTDSIPSLSVGVAGNYQVIATGTNGCTAIANTSVVADTLIPDVSVNSGMLNCSILKTSIQVQSNPSALQISWIGPGGFLSNQATDSVSLPGNYIATVFGANGCTTMATVMVHADVVSPDVFAIGDTLTCTDSTLFLNSGSAIPGAGFNWSGPFNFSASAEDVYVDAPGLYTVTVTNPSNGCTASATALVQVDSIQPSIQVTGIDTLRCALPTFLLTGSSNQQVSWNWVLPDGSSLQTNAIPVQVPGSYTFSATGSNGCVNSTSIFIPIDTLSPDLSAFGDTLDCFSGFATLSGQSLTPGLIWSWTGPGNFNSMLQNPTTSTPGLYTLTALAPNGCQTTVNTTVIEYNSLPQVAISGMSTLNCLDTTLTLLASISANVLGQWNTGISDTVLIVTSPGIYSFTAVGTNGCVKVESVQILQDIESPKDVLATGGLVNCSMPKISLYGASTSPNVSWNWSGPGNFFSTAQNPDQVTEPGLYTLTVLNTDNGCVACTTATVLADFAVPVVDAVVDSLSCLAPQVQIEISSIAEVELFQWTGPGNFSSTQEDPWVTLPGQYQLLLTAANGCTGAFELNVPQNIALPGASAIGDTLNCNAPTGMLMGISPSPNALYNWNGPNGFQATGPHPAVQQAGQYFLTVTGMNGCSSTAAVSVESDFAQPGIAASAGVLNCHFPSAILNALTLPGNSILWSGPGNFQSTEQNPSTHLPGTYTVTATGINGCTSSASVVVVTDTLTPLFSIEPPVLLDCNTQSVTLQATIQSPGQYNVQWNTSNGHLLSGANSTLAMADLPGSYTIVVTSVQNGCSSSQTVSVVADSNLPTALFLSHRDISCYGYNDGVITVDSIAGGTKPMLFSLDGGDFTEANQYGNLTPGSHTIQMLDASGCTLEAGSILNEPDLLTVDLGPDTLLHLGNPIALFVLGAVNAPQRVTKFITTPLPLQGDTVLYPIHSFRYTLWVQDNRNCSAFDERFIQVNRQRNVYIPNIFSPDQAGKNSILTVYGGVDVRRIKTFRIYDRWGELVHEAIAFPPNDESAAWDARMNGQPVGPGVFVYVVEVEFVDGESEVFSGDITVIR